MSASPPRPSLLDHLRRIARSSVQLPSRIGRLEVRLEHLINRNGFPSARPYYYLGGNRALTQLSNGLPFYINTNDKGVAPWIIMGGEWETFVDTVLTRLCQPGMRVLDLGANLGYYTIRLADMVGNDGYVLSLEPNPELFPFVRDNVELNGFKGRVRAEQLAASAERGVLQFQFDINNMGGGTLFGLAPEIESRRLEVQTAPVDDLIGGEPGFDLIKIDVEGWEPEVFRGMRETLARSGHGSLVTEVSWGHWSRFGDPADILRTLLGTQRALFVIHLDGSLERVSPDDLAPFQNQMRYALLTPWDETQRRLGDLVRR
jgi:FkbM family methyltransferase